MILLILTGCQEIKHNLFGHCEADFTISASGSPLVDGEEIAEIDFCKDHSMDAEFEFDPDDIPELRTPSFYFSASDSPDFECHVRLRSVPICSESTISFNIQSVAYEEATLPVDITTLDCEGIPDQYETASFTSYSGELTLDTIDTGSKTGNHSGERINTTIEGSLALSGCTTEGFSSDETNRCINVVGDFVLQGDITGEDAEEAYCPE